MNNNTLHLVLNFIKKKRAVVIFDKLHVLKKFNSQVYKLKLCTNIPS